MLIEICFVDWQTLGMFFSCRNKVDCHNHYIHAPIYLENTWYNNFFSDQKLIPSKKYSSA